MQILHTERLRLRWFRESDAGFVRRLLNEPSWIANIGDRQIHSDDDALDYIRGRLLANYWRQGFGFWAVERHEDGALIGMCGLTQRDSLPDPDVGYALLPAYWGRGYAREGAAACLAYAREVLGLRTLRAITAPHNLASQRVLLDIGLVPADPPRVRGEEGESCAFVWHATTAEPDDAGQIDALIGRFFAAFGNRGGALPTLAALPHACLPEARIQRCDAAGALTLDLHGFITPRAELLASGRLCEFEEHETAARTDLAEGLAQRWSQYRKRGVLDGVPFEAEGRKAFQLVRTARGWKIAALAWQDLA
ncbi:GNAT family N-acetyltransferase [Aquabacterium sp.]|uniref:GNAT family N-acetyltransferase n=1 Tax=Aquabacterium sp. TaxID=1872578 RepID=UPI0037849A8B